MSDVEDVAKVRLEDLGKLEVKIRGNVSQVTMANYPVEDEDLNTVSGEKRNCFRPVGTGQSNPQW